MFMLFLIFSIALLVTADFPVCPPGGMQFNPSQILPFSVDFPRSVNGTVQHFPTNYKCNYTINVAQGSYAEVWVTFRSWNKTDENSKTVVTDPSGFSEVFTQASSERFCFLSSGGKVFLSTGISEASFFLTIIWRRQAWFSTIVPIKLNASNTEPSIIFINKQNVTYLVTAETKVSILAIPSFLNQEQSVLRGVFIYDRSTSDSTLMGSAMHLWSSNKQWVSSGNQVSIEIFFADSYYNRSLIVLQDYENTKHIVNYQCGYCAYSSNDDSKPDCQFTLDNSLGTSAVMTYSDPYYGTLETIKSLNGNGTLDVYLGGVTLSKRNLVVSYAANNSGLTLPQTFSGTTRTYVLEGVHSKAIMNITRYFGAHPNPMGSRKIIMSDFYPQLHSDQSVSHALGALPTPNNTLVTYSYRIRFADFAKNSILSISVKKYGNWVYNQTFSVRNPPPINKTINIVGDWMSVTMDSTEVTRGFLMDYEILKAASSNFSVLIFVSTLVMGFI